ncbi:aminoglycoside phosphotransferase (APT) family kinase protein [Kribbella aluminosa]|uniref:Aminoglycoside phosphotransferase (APT) family kinase protein n=1 Tax=Kribbella aluminosa TaxID=416017 RepID=A0ABS4UPU1_9ACTN|nr:aminoglycoside phosphotransferase family protein [Kribbella aluminosa]MBP2353624.1 aminoglycoside phosphotransferase (APT) family kinase protein [Kribbella aluminosa]
MRVRGGVRAPGAFQRAVGPSAIDAICRRAFGSVPLEAVELGYGSYNSVYRIELSGWAEPVILRVAPEERMQFASEQRLMRNEYLSVSWLTAIAQLTPRVLAVDWSHEIVDRDWMIQSRLSGVPAPEQLGRYPRSGRTTFFRQLGAIARTVHDVRGPYFGRVAGPSYSRWSEAVIASLLQIADDLEQLGLDAADVRQAADAATHGRATLDEIREPRLLTGDLWTANCLLDADAPEPLISGVLDFDRTEFGDPAADWTIRMAQAKQDEREAFWDSYGALDRSPGATWRAAIYEARHLAAIRLERHRLNKPDAVRQTYDSMSKILAALT